MPTDHISLWARGGGLLLGHLLSEGSTWRGRRGDKQGEEGPSPPDPLIWVPALALGWGPQSGAGLVLPRSSGQSGPHQAPGLLPPSPHFYFGLSLPIYSLSYCITVQGSRATC